MKDELKCGCGGNIVTGFYETLHTTFFKCDSCPLTATMNLPPEQAVAAFRKATRADKQGVEWISVKDQPVKITGLYLIYNANSALRQINWECISVNPKHINPKFTHWAEINLPEKEQK